MIANFPVWGKAQRLPKFEYTGDYEYIDDGSGNWRIRFLTSGTFTPSEDMAIDAFLVGGGGGGGQNSSTYKLSSGGGGGYTTTQLNITLTAKTAYPIVIGAGGAPSTTHATGDGEKTTAFSQTAAGGKEGRRNKGGLGTIANGGYGGSGGGDCEQALSITAHDGQSDGGGGTDSGEGQGTTTREFGESTGTLYSGGGGAYAYSGEKGNGGAGGGANGGESAVDNTGGGGGGGGYGGSGIVVIRNTRAA